MDTVKRDTNPISHMHTHARTHARTHTHTPEALSHGFPLVVERTGVSSSSSTASPPPSLQNTHSKQYDVTKS